MTLYQTFKNTLWPYKEITLRKVLMQGLLPEIKNVCGMDHHYQNTIGIMQQQQLKKQKIR